MQMELAPMGLGESRERRLIARSHTRNEVRGIVLIRRASAQATKLCLPMGPS
jgi:hypothetical protein